MGVADVVKGKLYCIYWKTEWKKRDVMEQEAIERGLIVLSHPNVEGGYLGLWRDGFSDKTREGVVLALRF